MVSGCDRRVFDKKLRSCCCVCCICHSKNILRGRNYNNSTKKAFQMQSGGPIQNHKNQGQNNRWNWKSRGPEESGSALGRGCRFEVFLDKAVMFRNRVWISALIDTFIQGYLPFGKHWKNQKWIQKVAVLSVCVELWLRKKPSRFKCKDTERIMYWRNQDCVLTDRSSTEGRWVFRPWCDLKQTGKVISAAEE